MDNILVIKNNTDNTEYIILQKTHTVTIPKNPEELDKILAQQTPDTIILDIQDHEKRINTYLKIKKHKQTRNFPILIIAGKTDPIPPHKIDSVEEAYLKTPFTPQELQKALENLSKKKKELKHINVLYIAQPDEPINQTPPEDTTIFFEKTSSPTHALKLLHEKHYDCILLSYKLVDTDGIHFYEEIKTHTDIPTILYTGEKGEDIAEKAYEAGLDDFIRRAQDVAHYESLYERIHKVVERRKLHRILEHNLDLVENISDAIVSADHRYYINSWNKAAENLYGISKDEAINRFVFDLGYITIEDGMHIGTEIWRNDHWEGEQTHFNRDGTPIRIHTKASTLKNSNGDVVGYVSVNRDVTEHKRVLEENAAYKKRLEALYTYSVRLDQAESKEEVYKITFDAIHDAIEAKYHEFKIVDGNNLNGVYPKKYKSSMPVDGPGITTRTVREKRTQRVNNVHLDSDYKMGSDWTDVYSEMSVPILIEGNPVAVINVEHEAEEAFSEQDQTILETFAISVSNALVKLSRLENLEDIIRQRTIELEKSYRQLQELDKNKDQFISAATHELRTPLTSIIGYLDLIQITEWETETIKRDYCPIIRRNTQKLIYLTDNLLDQQRINMNRLNITKHKVDLIKLTTQIMEELRLLAEEKEIKLNVSMPEKPVIMRIDKVRVSQVITNLMDNAIKFSEEKGVVELTINETPSEVEFCVKDQGYGLLEEDIDKLFKPFPSIEKPVYYRSTGLGLSISKGIVELHGGRIWAESKGRGKGATFCFILPKD